MMTGSSPAPSKFNFDLDLGHRQERNSVMTETAIAMLIANARDEGRGEGLAEGERMVPSQISVSGILRVLQALLTERISIRDLPTILEGIAEVAGGNRTAQMIAEHVRSRLSRQLCAANLGPDGNLPLLTLSPQWEREFAEAMSGPLVVWINGAFGVGKTWPIAR